MWRYVTWMCGKLYLVCFTVIAAYVAQPLWAAPEDMPPSGMQDEAPFDPQTGYRIGQYRAPVPAEAEGAKRLSALELDRLIQADVSQRLVLLDVYGARQFQVRNDGSWITAQQHETLPNAHWLPVVAWGQISPWAQDYLDVSLQRITQNDPEAPIVVYCRVDCWLGWNAVKRLSGMGYSNLFWFPGGSDEWSDYGFPLVPVQPYPARVLPPDQSLPTTK